MNIFWAKGYDGTSLSDLTKGTGLQKGSLYGAFGDKGNMFQLALLEYDQVAVDHMVAVMDSLPGDQGLRALMLAPANAVDANDRRGCLLCNSLAEYSKLDEVARRMATRSRLRLLAAIERALVSLSGDVAQNALALHILATYVGLGIMARGGVEAASLRVAGEAAIAHL
jgi:AcrR family transcriptional regulator